MLTRFTSRDASGLASVPGGERGSAIILVLLVMLALSAIGMVGMRNVTRGAHLSGTYRARTSAEMYADAVGQFMAQQIGSRAQSMLGGMKKRQRMSTDDLDMTGGTISQNRGMKLQFDSEASSTKNAWLNSMIGSSSDSDNSKESGLFTWSNVSKSFESNANSTSFDVVIRNSVDMPAPAGYSKEFCFKKVTIAARAHMGNTDDNWDEARTVGVGQTMFEAMVGPMQCE